MGIIIRQSVKGTIVNYIGTLIGMFTTLFVLAKFLSQEEIGLTRAFIDAGVLFAGLAQIGTNASIFRFFPYFKNSENNNNGFFFWTIILPFIGFCFYLIVFLLLKNNITIFFSKESELFVNYFYFIIPLGFFLLYQTVFETNSVVLQRVVVPSFVREVGIRLMLLVSYFLFAYDYITLTTLIITICFTYFTAAAINLGYLFYLGKISLKPKFHYPSKKLKKEFLFYTLFLMASALTTAIVPTLGSFYITAKLGLAFTGVYTIAKYIATLIDIPYRSLGAISSPHISQTLKDKDFTQTNRLIKKISLHQFLIGTVVFFVIWSNIDLIFQFIPNGDSFAAGKWVVFFLGLTSLLNTSLVSGATTLSFSKYYYYSLLFTFILTTSVLILNVLYVPKWGITGAALAQLSSYFLYFLLLLSLVFWKLKVIPLSWKHLKILFIILILFGLDALWKHFITASIFHDTDVNRWISALEAVVRTAVLGGLGFLCVYSWKISEEVNGLLQMKKNNASN